MSLEWPWPEETPAPTICSCGQPGCAETSWEHEWDPVDCNDSCSLLCGSGIGIGDEYVRWGSGYAHRECAEVG